MTEHTETPQRRNSIRRLLPDEEIPPGVPARYVSSHGYMRLRWRAGNHYVEEYEHRIAAGRPAGDLHVHHLNGDKLDNRPDNLQVLDAVEHAILHGGHKAWRFYPSRERKPYEETVRGAKEARRKAREAELEERRQRWRDLYLGGMTHAQIGAEYGVHGSQVTRALKTAGMAARDTADYRATGRRDHLSKLQENQVVEIRQRFSDGESMGVLAEEFALSDSTVSNIVNGKIWRTVGGPVGTHGKLGRRPVARPG